MMRIVQVILFVSVCLLPTGIIFGLDGSGTETEPYLITSFADFEEFRTGGSYWLEGVHIRLETDIDLDPALPGRKTYDDALIGTYRGVFDGADHKISNFVIYAKNTGGLYIGFFSSIYYAKITKRLSQNN